MRVGIGRIERLLHQVDKSVAYVVLEAKKILSIIECCVMFWSSFF